MIWDISHFGTFMTEISEVPNIQFIGNASNITENDGMLTVCAVAGQLVQESTPVSVVISTSSGVARGNKVTVNMTIIQLNALLLQLALTLKTSTKSFHLIRATKCTVWILQY